MTRLPVCFLIPARGGSRRVPGKNLRTVAGIPLVGWATRAARIAMAGLVDGPHAVICSTDDPSIAAAAATWGAEIPFIRPASLATDTATSIEVALHALETLERAGRRFRSLVLVQPTSPLLDPVDLRRAVERSDTARVSVTSVVETHPVAWHHAQDDAAALHAVSETVGGRLLLAGAFYVISPTELRETGRFVSPGVTLGARIPIEAAIDIDTESDLTLARAMAHDRPVRHLAIAGRTIGSGGVFVIAEAGVNHDGDPAIAHALVDVAADAGADAVKFQTFDPDRLAAEDAPLAAYQRAAGEQGSGQRAMLSRLALPNDVWGALQEHATDRGILFLSSPFDEGSADLLEGLDVPAFKVGSGELTNHRFLAHLARKGRPMLVSTGMATMAEVDEALAAIREAGDPPVGLFHCVSNYPADPADANLAAIRTLRDAFLVPAGWSDHSAGITLAIAAVAMGADMIEKHVTIDRSRSGPDHAASLEPAELRAMVSAIRAVELATGDGDKMPTAGELEVALVARRGLRWALDLRAGTVIEPAHLLALRPGNGISPSREHTILGRRLRVDASAGAAVRLDDLDEPAP